MDTGARAVFTITFPDMRPERAAYVLRELERELIAAGIQGDAIRLRRTNNEAMDVATVLDVAWSVAGHVATGVIGAIVAKGVVQPIAHKLEPIALKIRAVTEWVCERFKIEAEVTEPSGKTRTIGSRHADSNLEATAAVLGTLGLVILGASKFTKFPGSELDNPAFAHSAELAEKLFSPDLSVFKKRADSLSLFDRDTNTENVLDKIIDYLDANKDITDLIIYYCGHGSFTPQQEYFLLLKGTKPGREGTTGLLWNQFLSELDRYVDGKRVYFVLDCCYAAAAVKGFQGTVDRLVEVALQDLPTRGSAVISASSKSERAMAPHGSRYTMFTGALAHVLQESRRRLSFAEIVVEARRYLKAKYGREAVLPEVHAPRQEAGNLTIMPLFGRAGSSDRVAAPESPDIAGTDQVTARLTAFEQLIPPSGARPIFERELAICEKELGPEHPDTAKSLIKLADQLRDQGDLAGAQLRLERALAIREKALGPEHNDTALSLIHLAMLLRDQGNPTGARPLLERALAICDKLLGAENPHAAFKVIDLIKFANMFRNRAYFAEARSLYERVALIRGPWERDIHKVLANLPPQVQ